MFERFGADARAAVVEAQTIARAAGSRSIDSRHVLLALIQETGPASAGLRAAGIDAEALAGRLRGSILAGGLDAEALASLGIDLDAVRARADAVFGAGALDRASRKALSGHIPFTSDAKKSLELALREALRLGASTINGGHLLLGILRTTSSPAAIELSRAMVAVGSDISALRSALEHPEAQAS
jgi:ATP-dependent Clp protease ATP-binding subunit ClpA